MKKLMPVLLVILVLSFCFTGCTEAQDQKVIENSQLEEVNPSTISSRLNGSATFNSGTENDKSLLSFEELYRDVGSINNYWEWNDGENPINKSLIFNFLEDPEDRRYLYGSVLFIFEKDKLAMISSCMIDLDKSILYIWNMYNDDNQMKSFNGEYANKNSYNAEEISFSYNLLDQSFDIIQVCGKRVPAGGHPYWDGKIEGRADTDEDVLLTKIDSSKKINSTKTEESVKTQSPIDVTNYAAGHWYIKGERYDSGYNMYERELTINDLGNGKISFELFYFRLGAINCETILNENKAVFTFRDDSTEISGSLMFNGNPESFNGLSVTVDITSSNFESMPVETMTFDSRHGGIFDDGRDEDELN